MKGHLGGLVFDASVLPQFMSARQLFFLAAGTLLVGVGLLSCGETKSTSTVPISNNYGAAPTPTEAQAALNAAFAAYNDYCLSPGQQGAHISFPFSLVNPGTQNRTFQYRQLEALVQVGLLDTSHVEARRGLPLVRFSLTQKGKKAQYNVVKGQGRRTAFCYAVPKVTGLDSIKSVFNSGPNPLAKVWFSYQYQKRGEWVNADSIQKVFANIRSLPQRNQPESAEKLLVRVGTTWTDRRLVGVRPRRSDSTSTLE